MTIEQMVREVLEAVKRDESLFEAYCRGVDPQTFSSGDLIVPANRLNECLRERPALSLFEIETPSCGESYVRSYCWAASEEAARAMFAAEHPTHQIERVVMLFQADAAPFCTWPSDSGFARDHDDK